MFTRASIFTMQPSMMVFFYPRLLFIYRERQVVRCVGWVNFDADFPLCDVAELVSQFCQILI